MSDNITVESIKADILAALAVSNLDTNEGSFTNDMVSAVALELWKEIEARKASESMFYVDETSGDYIDRQCAWYGITRKPGTLAAAVLSIAGTDGTVIPAGKVFLTAGGYQFVVDAEATIAGGIASVPVTALAVGSAYNVDASTITLQTRNIAGVSSVTNAAAAFGGSDPETDAALLARLLAFRKNSATSGNAYHYRQWALETDGVGDAKVYPLWDGPGTVKVLVVGSGKGPVDAEIVGDCAEHIEALRPIGAEVTVLSAEALAVDVSAVVVIESSTTLAAVSAAFEEALTEYLQTIAFDKYTLVYNRIAYMLLDIFGVADYTTLTVNGGTDNITISADQVPVRGTVVIS